MKEKYSATRDWPYHVSCGGAVYREVNGIRRYVLLYRAPRDENGRETWHLPKGTLQRDETLEQCALREIREESGVEAVVEGYLGSIHNCWTDVRGRFIDKTTHYFLCRCAGEAPAGMDDEHDRVDWGLAEEAIEKLNTEPKQEAEIIRRAERFRQVFAGE
jgi:8-oxo-dGTP pyrophosphatase MutT (NUDIX family)